MTIGRLLHVAARLAVILPLVVACASTPDRPKTSGVVFTHPIETARQGALDALVVLGFDVKKQDPTYIEGFRPRKVGLLVEPT